MPEDHQEALIRRAKAGDEIALTVLLTWHHQRLRERLARRIPADLRGMLDADDVLQEAEIAACRNFAGFEPSGPDAFYRWLGMIALQRLRNKIKAERAAKRGGGKVHGQGVNEESLVALLELMGGPEKSPSRKAARLEAIDAVQEALAQLPAAYRQAVQLVYLDGLSVAAAAAAMGRSERAVHNLCLKSKKYLGELLGSASRFLSSSG
jgi:RNA polymerase sigma-70 factor (ECF subfamily)